MRRLIFLYLLFSLPFLSRSQSSPTADLPQLLDSLEVIMEQQDIPGLMLTLVRDDSVIYKGGLGVKDIEANVAVDENTLFRLGSITKSFVALGVLKLVAEGKFSLEDEVKLLAPEITFDNAFEPDNPVRIKHLLSHTAGFDDMHFKELYNTSDEVEFPLSEVVKLSPQTLRVRWEPGSRYAYSNPGWSMAGYLIEKYSGQKYDAYITDNILRPIGMTASNFKSVPEGAQYARGYKGKGEEVPFLPIYHRPAGAFNSNAAEMSVWLQFLLQNGRYGPLQVLDSSMILQAEEPAYTLANLAGLPVGYGLGNYTFDAALPVQFHGHDGGIDGFVSSYGYNRQYGIGYAISNNGSKGMGQLVDLIKQFLTSGIEKPKAAVFPLDTAAMKSFEGFYVFKASRNQLFSFADRLLSSCKVEVVSDTVRLKYFAKSAFPVLPVRNDKGEGLLFRGVDESFPSHVFVMSKNGPVMATAGVGNYLEKGDKSAVYTKRVLFFGSVALLLSSLLASLVWLIFAIKKSLAWVDFFKRIVPSIAAIALFLVVLGMINTLNDLGVAASVNGNNLMLYLGTWAVLFCALLSSRFAIMNFKTGKSTAFSVYYVFLAASTVMMALFLYDAGWMGLKLWEY